MLSQRVLTLARCLSVLFGRSTLGDFGGPPEQVSTWDVIRDVRLTVPMRR